MLSDKWWPNCRGCVIIKVPNFCLGFLTTPKAYNSRALHTMLRIPCPSTSACFITKLSRGPYLEAYSYSLAMLCVLFVGFLDPPATATMLCKLDGLTTRSRNIGYLLNVTLQSHTKTLWSTVVFHCGCYFVGCCLVARPTLARTYFLSIFYRSNHNFPLEHTTIASYLASIYLDTAGYKFQLLHFASVHDAPARIAHQYICPLRINCLFCFSYT